MTASSVYTLIMSRYSHKMCENPYRICT